MFDSKNKRTTLYVKFTMNSSCWSLYNTLTMCKIYEESQEVGKKSTNLPFFVISLSYPSFIWLIFPFSFQYTCDAIFLCICMYYLGSQQIQRAHSRIIQRGFSKVWSDRHHIKVVLFPKSSNTRIALDPWSWRDEAKYISQLAN